MSFLSRDFDQTAQAEQESVVGMLRRLAGLSLQLAALIMLSSFPLGIPHFSAVRPSFLAIAVYNWAVFAPQKLSPLAAFMAGFALDLLSSGPVGLNALALLAVQRVALRQRKFLSGQPYLVVWLGFWLVSAAVFLLQWAGYSLYYWKLEPGEPMLLGALLTALCYPPVVWVLNALGRVRGRR
jgi:rod shape-determining protein MreD